MVWCCLQLYMSPMNLIVAAYDSLPYKDLPTSILFFLVYK